jgi:plasminogen activator inhibitor 1 RNA-binding protein
LKKGWGDNRKKLDDEAAGDKIAKSDETKDVAEGAEQQEVVVEEEDKTKTLDEYFAELTTKSEELKSNRGARRQANDGVVDAKWDNANELVREEEEFVHSSNQKSLRQKNRKERVVLETEINFAPPQQNQRPRSAPRRGGASGPRRGGRHDHPRSNAPAVNISNTKEFPTLGQ